MYIYIYIYTYTYVCIYSQARFWVQVISELRKGVKLKKVEANLQSRGQGQRRGAEFELTPYEILMDDIRERRYRLKKAPSPTPYSKKDVHAIILEFIRSRPPLKKVTGRGRGGRS